MYAIKYIVVLACLSTPAASSDDEDNDEGFLSPAIRAALRYTSGNLIQSDIHQLIEASDKSRLAAAKDLLSGSLDEWKRSKINIGVTGDSGTGKSSLVNALRGLTGDDYGAAHVGVTETTMEPESYKHPDNPNMLLWDLPGVGTPRFTRDNYFDKIQLMKYDYFIIVTSTRFTDEDKWLVTELKKRNKRFYFVRTKISIDIENDKKSHPKTHDQEKVCSDIRKDIMKHINNLANDVYLIDSYDTDKYDFKKLSYKLVVDAPELKREAMLFTLNIFSEEMVKAKKAALKERIPTVSLLSALFGAVPIPGLDVAVDVAILMSEIKFYKEQLGLTDNDITIFAEKMKIPFDKCINFFGLKSVAINCTVMGILAFMAIISAKKAKQKVSTYVLKYLLPGIGIIVAASVAYYTCSATLENALYLIADDALKIARHKF